MLMRKCYARDLRELKVWSEAVATWGREKQLKFLDYCQRLMRENFMYNFRQPELCYMTQEEEDFSKKFSPFINERNIIEITENISRAQKEIGQNANAKILFFDFAMNYIYFVYDIYGEERSYLHNLPVYQRKLRAVADHTGPHKDIDIFDKNKHVKACIDQFLSLTWTSNERLLDAMRDDIERFIAHVQSIPHEFKEKVLVEIHNPESPITPAIMDYVKVIEETGSKYIAMFYTYNDEIIGIRCSKLKGLCYLSYVLLSHFTFKLISFSHLKLIDSCFI